MTITILPSLRGYMLLCYSKVHKSAKPEVDKLVCLNHHLEPL